MKGIAIVVAAGKSSRAGVDKIWTKIDGKTVLERAAEPFFASPVVSEIVLVVSEEKKEEATALFSRRKEKPVFVVCGGETRTQSVRNALDFIRDSAKDESIVVGVHDGARPYLSPALAERCFLKAAEKGSAVPVIPCVDSMRKISGGGNSAVDRSAFVLVQTPQCFLLDRLVKAYESGAENTDDASLYETVYGAPELVEGEAQNKKITYSSDLSDLSERAERRVGIGYDVHPLALGRKLVLGGVEIPFEKGLVGHSDADALTHAIMDALLTAAGLPDIGHFFPPSDPSFEGAYSVDLLKIVKTEIEKKGFAVHNVAAMIMAERPKMAGYIPEMEKTIAKTLGISEENVKVAATTTEKLGIVGEEKGIAAEATALLVREKTD